VSDWFEAGSSGSPVDVPAMFDSGVPELLAGAVSLGALVSIGTTSDGGALGVTVTLDGRWRREYFREADALIDWLTGAVAALQDTPRSQPASSAPRSGRRSRGR
jgi:hypothetical protein